MIFILFIDNKKINQIYFLIDFVSILLVRTEMSLEETPGFEPGIRVLQTRALPLGYIAITIIYDVIKKILP